MRAEDSRAALNRYEQMLMDLTSTELAEHAEFDQNGFTLKCSPSTEMDGIEMGCYELPRSIGEAHLYRLQHPLAVWITEQAKNRQLSGARLTFDYDGYGNKVSTLTNAVHY